MGAAEKKSREDVSSEGEGQSDRELKLAKGFEDLSLAELLPDANYEAPELGSPSLLADTAEAVHEILQANLKDSSPEAPAFDLFDLPMPSAEERTNANLIVDASELSSSSLEAPSFIATVNANPDVLERSLILQIRPEEQDLSGSLNIDGQALESDVAVSRMANAFFDLVACERTFDDVVETGLRAIMDVLSAQAGSVLELDHKHEDFFFRASSGGSVDNTQLKTFRVPLTKGIVGHVAESGEPLLIRDLKEDTRQMRAISLSVGFEAVTCMAAPILVGGQPYGVIEVFNRRDGSLFETRDLSVLEQGVRMFAKVLEVRFVMAALYRKAG